MIERLCILILEQKFKYRFLSVVQYVSPIKFSHILILTNIAKLLIVIFKKKFNLIVWFISRYNHITESNWMT